MNTADKLAQLARANQNKQKNEKKKSSSFQLKVIWGSHQYVRYVKEKCKELALKGYGSVEIKIDRTTDDLFYVDEGRNSCYSSDFVCKLLSQEGFKFDNEKYVDYYDAFSTLIVWDKALPSAPNSERIGMCWK